MANYVESIKVGTGETWPVRDAEAHKKLNSLVDLVYPIGSIYMSVNSTSPSELFGGSWETIRDRFLLAAGDKYAAGSTGGEATVTLTEAQMPSHFHYGQGWAEVQDGSGTYKALGCNAESGPTYHTNSAGGGQPHNNMPPYLAVHMWKRVS